MRVVYNPFFKFFDFYKKRGNVLERYFTLKLLVLIQPWLTFLWTSFVLVYRYVVHNFKRKLVVYLKQTTFFMFISLRSTIKLIFFLKFLFILINTSFMTKLFIYPFFPFFFQVDITRKNFSSLIPGRFFLLVNWITGKQIVFILSSLHDYYLIICNGWRNFDYDPKDKNLLSMFVNN